MIIQKGFYFNETSTEKLNEIISAFADAGWGFISEGPHGKGTLLVFVWHGEEAPTEPSEYLDRTF